MSVKHNAFKTKLRQGQVQIGCWAGMADAYATEMLGTCGFDWLLLDGEHAPNDIRSLLTQLQALEASASHPVVRLPVASESLVKQVLDLGAQSLLIPMIETPQQAEQMVRAVRYPPKGTRGVGAALARASQFGQTKDYLNQADEQICLLLQVENSRGIEHLESILAVEGFDGVFLGPSDLAADMGFRGQTSHPSVRQTVLSAIDKIKQANKVAGILSLDDEFSQHCIDRQVEAVAVGIDVVTFVTSLRQLARSFKANLNP